MFPKSQGHRVRNYVEYPDQCSHLGVYLFLKKHFGKPTGTNYDFDGTKYKNSSYEKYGAPRDQWFYLIKTSHGYIEIYDRERSWLMITIYLPHKISAENTRSRELLEKDLKVFMTKLGEFCSSIKNKKTNVREGMIVLNSFEIHYSNYRYHLKLLKRLMKKVKASKHFHDQIILDQMRMLTQSAFILLVSSFESFIKCCMNAF
jgi:hypothetical protein